MQDRPHTVMVWCRYSAETSVCQAAGHVDIIIVVSPFPCPSPCTQTKFHEPKCLYICIHTYTNKTYVIPTAKKRRKLSAPPRFNYNARDPRPATAFILFYALNECKVSPRPRDNESAAADVYIIIPLPCACV